MKSSTIVHKKIEDIRKVQGLVLGCDATCGLAERRDVVIDSPQQMCNPQDCPGYGSWDVLPVQRASVMFSHIVGSIFILLGVLFLLYPEALRKRLRRKAVWRLRRWFFAAALFFGALLVSVGWKQPGLLPKVLVLIGVAAILKGLLLLNSKATEKITAWVLSRPILHLRIFAVAEIAMGLLILLGLRA
jgi:hypothetical protein